MTVDDLKFEERKYLEGQIKELIDQRGDAKALKHDVGPIESQQRALR
jgi:hypothetical protein